ncbi:MAG: tRNA (guanosine(46)-N7)-methyltransferase TrmB [Planctomycetota bacterium]|nr:tRNA (guanosine(46)-N7)-methyltransferase TrmB [Planctomycetota bacterium]
MPERSPGKESDGIRPAGGCSEPESRAGFDLPSGRGGASGLRAASGAGGTDGAGRACGADPPAEPDGITGAGYGAEAGDAIAPAGAAEGSGGTPGSGAAFDPELHLEGLDAPLDVGRIFGLPGPLVLEIGCGKGRYLLARAAASPAVPFLGIEYAAKYLRIMKERAAKKGLCNVRLVRAEAAAFISRFLPDGSVRELHVYFPDPWPKRRHHKRRLFTPDFVADIHRVLASGAGVYFATDFMDYFRIVIDALKPAFDVEELAGPWPDSPGGRTNYEIKYMAEGRPIGRAIARKRG